MTCIVGFSDKDKTYIGCDSLGSDGYVGEIRKDKKIFKLKDNKNAIIGFTTSYRMGQILMYQEELIERDNVNHEYMVTQFIPKVINIFDGGGFSKCELGEKSGGTFLLAHKNSLYKIESDYQVNQVVDDYMACGCGENFALGSLFATENTNMSPVERIHKALQSASKYSVGVAPPFYIMNTETDEIIEFKE